MSWFLLTALFCLAVYKGEGLLCWQCKWSVSSSTDNCYRIPTSDSILSTQNCSEYFPNTQNPYCLTKLMLLDGLITEIERRCASSTSDHDKTTDYPPTKSKCVTSFSHENGSADVEATTCYLACVSANNCNVKTPRKLKACSYDCGMHGKCDFTTGRCVCEPGYSGEGCSYGDSATVLTPIHCVQCNDELDELCETFRTASVCPNPEHQFCAVSRTMTFLGAALTREHVTRSCTSKFVAEEKCFISKPLLATSNLDIVEYSCISTCHKSGCNTGLPDDKHRIDDHKSLLHCVVCNSDDNSIDCTNMTATTACDIGESYCVSVVTYFISNSTELSLEENEPSYLLYKVERKCASKPIETKCQGSAVGSSSLTMVTCQESCRKNACNTGWPARPQCSQCSCHNCGPGDACDISPPEASSCSKPYHSYCVIEDINRRQSTQELLYRHGYYENEDSLMMRYQFLRKEAEKIGYKVHLERIGEWELFNSEGKQLNGALEVEGLDGRRSTARVRYTSFPSLPSSYFHNPLT